MIIKTNWSKGDEFDVLEDFNRIKDNIREMYLLEKEVIGNFEMEIYPNLSRIDLYYLSQINQVEDNLKTLINKLATKIDITGLFEPTKVFEPGTPIWDEKDINRIEKTIEILQEKLLIIKNQKYRYSGTFYCGEDWGIDSI